MPALSPVAGRAGGEPLLLTEVPAILTYLARLRPELDLVPADPAREARTIEWTNWLSGWLHGIAFGALWRPGRFSDDHGAQPGIAAKGRANLLDAFAHIERVLEDGRAWAVPSTCTIVDAYLLVFGRWATVAGLPIADHRAWTDLARRTLARPAVLTAFRKDSLDLPAEPAPG